MVSMGSGKQGKRRRRSGQRRSPLHGGLGHLQVRKQQVSYRLYRYDPGEDPGRLVVDR